jgi:PEP-CTERM motif
MTARKRTALSTILALVLLCFGRATAVHAGVITYSFTADTSLAATQTGSLDIQFDGFGPGGSDTAVISAFSSVGGTLGAGSPTGSESGDLANLPVTFTDITPLNDLSQGVTFGTSLSFTVTLTTLAGSPGAAYTFGMYDGSGNPIDAIGGGNPSAVEIDVDQGGNQESPQLGPGVSGGAEGGSAVPEPASLCLAIVGAAGLVCAGWRRRRQGPATLR